MGGELEVQLSVRREYGEAIRYAQSILDCDALRADVHRERCSCSCSAVQRAQALRQFETCRDMLRRELAIQPMRETLALYRQIADSAIGGGQQDHDTRDAGAAAFRFSACDAAGRIRRIAGHRRCRRVTMPVVVSPPPASIWRRPMPRLELSLRQLDS